MPITTTEFTEGSIRAYNLQQCSLHCTSACHSTFTLLYTIMCRRVLLVGSVISDCMTSSSAVLRHTCVLRTCSACTPALSFTYSYNPGSATAWATVHKLSIPMIFTSHKTSAIFSLNATACRYLLLP